MPSDVAALAAAMNITLVDEELLVDENELNEDEEGESRPYLPLGAALNRGARPLGLGFSINFHGFSIEVHDLSIDFPWISCVLPGFGHVGAENMAKKSS